MSIGMAAAAAALGAVLPILLLRCPPRSARGWCWTCQTPDLWMISRATARSRVWSVLAWIAHAGLTLCAWHLVRTREESDPRDWLILGLLAVAELLVAHRSRLARRRLIHCRMCEADAEPRDLRRARAGQG